MKKNKSFKLLTKTSLFYLIFTFAAFFISALYLTNEADEFIHSELEQRFGYMERRLKRSLKDNPDLSRLLRWDRVERVEEVHERQENPVYRDTLIYNSETEDKQYFRVKTHVLEVGDKLYRVVLLRPADDFRRFRDDIFSTLIPAFIILAITVLLINYSLAGYFFRPFNRILEKMREYQVGKDASFKRVSTNTTEFLRMQLLFETMLDRIEQDYRNLKEYTEHMAHEIQTPLTIMRNKVENLIADEQVMVSNKDSVQALYEEVNQLSKLSTTLNLLTKIENREFSKTEKILTAPQIEKQIEAIKEVIDLKAQIIETDLSKEHSLLIDPYLFDILLRNLLKNAIRYGTNEGPIKIVTDHQQFRVSNFGPPLDIPTEKLYERFYRNGQSKNALGLGLALVKKICELNGLNLSHSYENGQHSFIVFKPLEN